jgi:hypothetical protein
MPILRTSREQQRSGSLMLGDLLEGLGEKSYGWAIVIFSLVTLLPLPPGSSLITALPVLITTGQMALGFPHVKLPARLARRKIEERKLRGTMLRLRPVTRRLERVLRPQLAWVYSPRYERLLGFSLFVVAFTLFLPVPLSGWFPALSLFVSGVGLVERDGLVSLIGLLLGMLSVALTILIVLSLAAGATPFIQ